MNRIIFALMLCGMAVSSVGIEVKLNSFGAPRTGKKMIVSEHSGIAVRVRAPAEEDISGITVRPEKDGLVVDASKLNPEKNVQVLFGVVTSKETVKSGTGKQIPGEPFTRLEVEFSAASDVRCALLFEGQTVDENGRKKHYWGARKFTTAGKREIVQFDKVFPENSSITRLRFDLPGGSVFKFHRAAFLRMEK